MVRVGCRQMDDISNQKILRTFFDGKIGCVELDEYWMPKLEKFCEVAGSLGFKSNESPQAMKVDQIKYHCMVHIPTEEIYAVAGVEYMPQYKEGYYRVWTRLSRIPNENIPMTKMVRYGRGHEMPEFDGLLYFNCKWANEQENFKATFGTTLANKAYSDSYVKSTNSITDYIKRNWWKRKGIAVPEGIHDFYRVPQVVWNINFNKFKEYSV